MSIERANAGRRDGLEKIVQAPGQETRGRTAGCSLSGAFSTAWRRGRFTPLTDHALGTIRLVRRPSSNRPPDRLSQGANVLPTDLAGLSCVAP